MIFSKTPIEGAYTVDIEPRGDARGFFARVSCEREFSAHGLNHAFKQCNMQYNEKRGTLRGLHAQRPPAGEEKLVRCTRGAIFDVIADARSDSPTYLRWFGAELSRDNRRMMYVPKGVAHGYVTLTDGAETLYMVTEFYAPGAEFGIRYDDPAFGIAWPQVGELTVSEKDRGWVWGRGGDEDDEGLRRPKGLSPFGNPV
jgi:dTDP-4-dehydrorhamnose 3,5-epimerase